MLWRYMRSAAFRGNLVPRRSGSRMSEGLLGSPLKRDERCRLRERVPELRSKTASDNKVGHFFTLLNRLSKESHHASQSRCLV
ncbi:hypothetical protein ACCAA_50119 [Candidatus Accumulibacter aalborgensis]|uniref:Uncharacterized protein n=1 Tax=Candidatus Accumulibacter aalborgensis TaxID=1860102 RepID=A0A1A8XTN2_9PROT|nr:hypothetical protein ACCAA_50119 [Candidatus Accumulibacter aalborgensis]